MNGMPGAGWLARKTESAALKELSPREQQELEAVERAIEDIGRQKDGAQVLKVVELYHWVGIYNLDTVAEFAHTTTITAKRRNARFVYAVARNLGYM